MIRLHQTKNGWLVTTESGYLTPEDVANSYSATTINQLANIIELLSKLNFSHVIWCRRSFSTPNYVTVPAPPNSCTVFSSMCLPLKDVDENTLALLCNEFRREVFEKAGKKDPSAF